MNKRPSQSVRPSKAHQITRVLQWGIFGAIVLVILTAKISQLFVSDPLPRSIRVKLDKVDAIGKNIEELVARVKAFNGPGALASVKGEYDAVQTSINQLVQKTEDEVQLNSVDTAALQPTLDETEVRAEKLRDLLYPLSRPIAKADFGAILEQFWQLVKESVQQLTDLAQTRADKARICITQLERMKMRPWEEVPKYSGSF